MDIEENFGITKEQLQNIKEKLKEELFKEEKPKHYWTKSCPNCDGHGRVVDDTCDHYRVFENDQGEGLGCVKSCGNLDAAKKYVSERKSQFFGRGSMFTIVAPDGEVVG